MRHLFLILLATVLFGQANAQQKQILDKVVGVVGQELILLSDIEDQYSLAQKQQPGGVNEDTKCIILDNILVQNLMLNQARLDSIEVTPDEVESQLDARLKQILAYMGNDERQFEDYYGAPVAIVKERFRVDLENKLLIERMQQDIISNATVTPSEVKAFFNLIPQDSLPFFNSEVELAEIVITPSINEKERQKALSRLEDIKKDIENGADFAEMAKKYSVDYGSGRAGGDLGWAPRGTYVLEFEAEAYNLEKGELSTIVETQFGFHLLELLDRRGNNVHVRHILIKPEITAADKDKAIAKLDSVRNLILADSINFNVAVNKFSDDDAPSASNGGNMVNPKTGNTFFEIGDLDYDVYTAIDTMQVNDISAPFEFKTASGEKAYRFVQLRSRTKPHKASLETDYSKIKTAALASKKNKFMEEWVVERKDNTFIQINPQYNCPNLDRWRKEQ